MTMTDQDFYNIVQSGDQRAWFTAQAQKDYYDALAQGASQDNALAWAKFRWQQKLDEAGQTGKWNGQWNNPQEQWFTGQFGTWFGEGGEPGVGQQTLQAQQQGYGQSNALGGLYGSYYAPGTGPAQGTASLAAGSQAAQQANARAQLTGYLQNTGSGNIVKDAWDMLDQGTQQSYLQSSPGGNDAQEAMNRYYQNYQSAVYARAKEAGVSITPQLMSDVVYGAWNQQGNETMEHQQQMFTQNLQTGQEARAAQAQQQSQTMQYLNMLTNLRGPADWAKYQQVLGSTPGGMRDLVAAAAGQYVPGGGATTGYQPQAASLQSLVGDVSGRPYQGQGGGQLLTPSVYTGGQGSYGTYGGGYTPQQYTAPGSQQYSPDAYSDQAYRQAQQGAAQPQTYQEWLASQGGAAYSQAPGTPRGAYWAQQSPQTYYGGQQQTGSGQVWGSGIGVGGNQATPQQQQQAMGNGTNMYGQNQYNLPAPNQISAQSWNNMAPSQKQMLLGMYEANGWDKNDVTALQNQSLPKYAQNNPTAGTWRLG